MEEEEKDKNQPIEAQKPEGELTPAQIHFLRMFSFNKSEAFLDEIKEVLSKHFIKKAEDKMERFWAEGLMDQDFLDKINEMDLHKLDGIFSKKSTGVPHSQGN